MANLLSSDSLVEVPFIIVQIGDYTFGSFTSTQTKIKYDIVSKVSFPNYMKSIDITKINGTLNMYNIVMEYPITPGDDPNLLEKVFSSVSNTRKILISYGDWARPSFIYREEEAIITKVTTNVNFANSRITYTLACTSNALQLQATNENFPARFAKPSDVIKELLADKRTGLQSVFTGMTDKNKILAKNLIASNDKAVQIEAMQHISTLEYLNYLTSCMTKITDESDDAIKPANYYLTVVDDITNEFGGPYFTVNCVDTSYNDALSYDTNEIDIGYPGKNFVTNFQIKNDDGWSILYDYAGQINQSNYIYRINNNGQVLSEFDPSISTSGRLFQTTQSDRSWWTQVTQFPITATLTIKGLLRPAILMTYVKINALFYGAKHISSGTYIITKHQDRIDNTGYKTTLTLLRVKGDTDSLYTASSFSSSGREYSGGGRNY